MKYRTVLQVLLLFGLCNTQPVYGTGNFPETTIVATVGNFHPNCEAAFKKLPIDEGGRALNETANGKKILVKRDQFSLKEHYMRYAKEYLAYDKACFFGWECEENCLAPGTRAFLANNAGALFEEQGYSEIVPFCTAFRISNNIILTAAHCSKVPNKQFRLFGDPHTPIKVDFLPLQDGIDGSDLNDYALLRINNPQLPFRWHKQDFTREIQPRQSIIIVAISNAVYITAGIKDNDWLDAVRFSRVNASQVLPREDVMPPPTTEAFRNECIYHTAPTFEGMSGAAILGLKLPTTVDGSLVRHVIGIHLRNGAFNAPCGNHKYTNIGIRIPKEILKRIGN